MCGICGVMSVDGSLDPAVRSALPAMTAALQHRGPDHRGVFADATAALGHARLSIIDRAGGDQPMTNEDRSCWIVFNGEIYNHRALRHRLEQRGHVFRSSSDTESILHAYEEFGADCVTMLDGMFAFAIYDVRNRELFIARDRLGKKPLFYATLGGALHFTSEIKAMRASPAWDPATDWSQLEGYLSLGYFLAPGTVYRHVHSLPAGHCLRLRNGRVEIKQYWDIDQFDNERATGDALEQKIEETLRRAVVDRLESEVPLGAFLSGGIDSGLVVSYMAETLGSGVTTTSVGFGEAGFNELDAAALTASRFKTDHHVEVVQPAPADVIDRIVEAFDQPFADASAIPTFHVAGMARRHVTVVLSGDGGDESFGGYGFRYAPHTIEDAARSFLPGAAGRSTAGWLGAHWPRSRHLPRYLRCGTQLENISRDPAAAYYADLCFVKPHMARALLGQSPDRDPSASPVYDVVTEPYRRCPSSSAVQRAMYADLKIYLANDVLVKVDRMTMQHGLEVRCPLLDHRVVELAFAIPARHKLPRLRSKHLLRKIAARRLPAELARMPKRGFSTPIGEWLAGGCANRFRDDVLQPTSPMRGVLDVDLIGRLFDEHRTGEANHAQMLWSVWMLARWTDASRQSRVATRAVEQTGDYGRRSEDCRAVAIG
jgi:asparagine synthase (glutamine-hydrolysing)